MWRFILIVASAFVANTYFLAALIKAVWLTPKASVLSAAAVIPVITFLAIRLWGFSQEKMLLK
jgi:hypothetical protein